MTSLPGNPPENMEAFISRWQGQQGGQERANYALLLTAARQCMPIDFYLGRGK
jgi:hypothetical protein